MNRRYFLKSALAVIASLVLPKNKAQAPPLAEVGDYAYIPVSNTGGYYVDMSFRDFLEVALHAEAGMAEALGTCR